MWGARGPIMLVAAMVGYGCVGRCWPLEAKVRSTYCRNNKKCLRKFLFYPFGGVPPKAQEPLFWTNQRPTTNQLTAEESKYSRTRAQRCGRPTNNLLEVWQNLSPFGGRPIGAAVEALLTKIINWQLLGDRQYCPLFLT
jgi:hypothetical protein